MSRIVLAHSSIKREGNLEFSVINVAVSDWQCLNTGCRSFTYLCYCCVSLGNYARHVKCNFPRIFQPVTFHVIDVPVIVSTTNNRDFECTKNCILIWNFPHMRFRWNFTILIIIVQYLDCVKFRFAIVQWNVFFSERMFEFRANAPLTNKNYISNLINALPEAIPKRSFVPRALLKVYTEKERSQDTPLWYAAVYG